MDQKEFPGYYDETLRRHQHALIDPPKDHNLFAAQHVLKSGQGQRENPTSFPFSLLFRLRHSFPDQSSLIGTVSKLRPLWPALQRMRWIKSAAEVRLMHKAGQITGEALIEVCSPRPTSSCTFRIDI